MGMEAGYEARTTELQTVTLGPQDLREGSLWHLAFLLVWSPVSPRRSLPLRTLP